MIWTLFIFPTSYKLFKNPKQNYIYFMSKKHLSKPNFVESNNPWIPLFFASDCNFFFCLQDTNLSWWGYYSFTASRIYYGGVKIIRTVKHHFVGSFVNFKYQTEVCSNNWFIKENLPFEIKKLEYGFPRKLRELLTQIQSEYTYPWCFR